MAPRLRSCPDSFDHNAHEAAIILFNVHRTEARRAYESHLTFLTRRRSDSLDSQATQEASSPPIEMGHFKSIPPTAQRRYSNDSQATIPSSPPPCTPVLAGQSPHPAIVSSTQPSSVTLATKRRAPPSAPQDRPPLFRPTKQRCLVTSKPERQGTLVLKLAPKRVSPPSSSAIPPLTPCSESSVADNTPPQGTRSADGKRRVSMRANKEKHRKHTEMQSRFYFVEGVHFRGR